MSRRTQPQLLSENLEASLPANANADLPQKTERKAEGQKCSVPECKRVGKTKKGFCDPHYKQMWRHGKIVRPVCRRDRPFGICSVPGCGRPEVHSFLCNSHYARKYRKVKVDVAIKPLHAGMQGPDHPLWKGGERMDGGRVIIWSPDHPHARRGYMYRYRLVMEESIGRYLLPEEVVHHINNNKSDDRIENLLLTNSSEHAKLHVKDMLAARKAKHGY